jgi:hypothetical protein
MSESIISPYPWQTPLVDFVLSSLKERKVAVSGFPTGSGKTVVALAAAKALDAPHLIVCPKVAISQWRRLADRMGAGHLLHGVINPEKLSTPRGCEFYDKVRRWRLPPNTYVVWDEPHRGAGGKDSAQTAALAYLRAYCQGLHAMSATVADSPLKLRALGFWLGLHDYHDDSFYSWCRRHGCSMESVSKWDPTRKGFKFTTDPAEARRHMLDIRREMGSAFMSMRSEDIPGFPAEIVEVKRIDLDANDRKAIDEAYEQMSDRMKSKARSWLAESARERERIEFSMAKALAELAAAYVAEGLSPVTFFNYTEPRLRFEAELRLLGVANIATICGGQEDDDRWAGIDSFQANETHAAAVMLKAGGAALSLHDVKHERPRVSMITPAYEADLIKQAFGRIRRDGGTPVVQQFMIAAGTVMEAVAARLETKTGNIDALNDGDMNPEECRI